MDYNDFVQQLNSVIKSNDSESPKNEDKTVIIPSNETQKTVKILIVSTHINQSNGYSKVTHNIIDQLSSHPWIKIVHFGTQKLPSGDIGRIYPPDVKVIDGTSLEKQRQVGFAFSELPGVIQSEKPDVVFMYNDFSIVCAYIE